MFTKKISFLSKLFTTNIINNKKKTQKVQSSSWIPFHKISCYQKEKLWKYTYDFKDYKPLPSQGFHRLWKGKTLYTCS